MALINMCLRLGAWGRLLSMSSDCKIFFSYLLLTVLKLDIILVFASVRRIYLSSLDCTCGSQKKQKHFPVDVRIITSLPAGNT